MKTLKVSIDQDEENQIFDSLIDRFDLDKSDIWTKYGQEINFPITEDVEVWAKLELYKEGNYEHDTNSWNITEQMVIKFSIDFLIDGEEIEVVRDQRSGTGIEDRIKKHYRI